MTTLKRLQVRSEPRLFTRGGHLPSHLERFLLSWLDLLDLTMLYLVSKRASSAAVACLKSIKRLKFDATSFDSPLCDLRLTLALKHCHQLEHFDAPARFCCGNVDGVVESKEPHCERWEE